MKLSVSTLGCPDWSLDEVIQRCRSYGYDAIELRGLGEHLDLTQSPEFATAWAIAEAKRRFVDAGMEISSVDTSAQFANPNTVAENLDEAKRAIDLAVALGASKVRVFGGDILAGVDRAHSLDSIVDSLIQIGDFAAETEDVVVVIETHDGFPTGASVAEVLGKAGHPQVAALWDVHETVRHGESLAETMECLGPKIRFTHIKDSHPEGPYVLLGQGDIPVHECLSRLAAYGYDGYVSVEWEKRWVPSLADSGIALPQYALKLREYLNEIESRA
jgi:sugar phosphate isomerase/epimerase